MKILVFFLLTFAITWTRSESTCDGPGCGLLVVDTDIGGDDAIAMALLGIAGKERLLKEWKNIYAVTTVTGNTGASNATRNAESLLKLLDLEQIPVYTGSEDGLAEHITPNWFYGYDGLGDFLPPPPPPDVKAPIKAPQFLADTVRENPKKVTLLCIGPLTNLALAVHIYPNFIEDVKHIYIMGGSYLGQGNTSPGVEANMYSDPDGAAYFFRKLKGLGKVTILPLETPREMKIPLEFRNKLGKSKNKIMSFLNKAEAVGNKNRKTIWPCYDPLLAAILIDPSILQVLEPALVSVVTEGPRGLMIAQRDSATPNVNIITKVNKYLLESLLMDLLGQDDWTARKLNRTY